jgi:polyhydroxyalkanoate synthesis repressor PhaR
MITIKKYSNRRLYDTDRSVYVNLEDVARLIREGHTLRVLDARTDEDLTRQVLLQVLLELPATSHVVPVALLHRIIRYTPDAAHPFQGMVAQQIAVGLDLLETQLSAFEQQFGWRPAAPPPPPPPPVPPDAPEPSCTARPNEPGHGVDAELDALRERLADLERRLGGPNRRA